MKTIGFATSHSGAGNPWFNLGLCRWPRRGLVRGMPSAANRYCWLRGGGGREPFLAAQRG